jgi:hypothetical protein
MQQPLRLIITKDKEENSVTLMVNCFDLSAKEISDLYWYQWKIEFFFKWMKLHLKIKSSYDEKTGRGKEFVWIVKQINEADHLNDLTIDLLYITMINLNRNYCLCSVSDTHLEIRIFLENPAKAFGNKKN